jgi:translation elongation factor EF-Ts
MTSTSNCGTCGKSSNHYVSGSYVHGNNDLPLDMGRIGAIVSLGTDNISQKTDISALANRIARHIVGMNPTDIPQLLEQDYLFGGGSVGDILCQFNSEKGVNVTINDFKRFECGL